MKFLLFIRLFFVLSLYFPLINGDFSFHFRNFLITRLGADAQRRLERTDMGIFMSGSFGGKIFETDQIRKNPIVFVHGATCKAGDWSANYFHYLLKGYTAAEMYATTWGDGGMTSLWHKTLACDDVKQIRAFILAVNLYTNSTVDIIAASEGAAIARKAILGGSCVDTKEALGQPLTPLIDTFVSVGGLNYGREQCTPQLGGCNLNNGQICSSEFMQDINNQTDRYEGQYSYYIYSDNDYSIGRNCCNHTCSELKNAVSFSRQIMPHGNLIGSTKDIQLEMIQFHTNPQNNNNTLYGTLFGFY